MGSIGTLDEEMRKSVGATGRPADTAEDTTPSGPAAKQEKPSQGAVLGAIGAVRGGAQACLTDTDKPTRVNVVFGSDGAVRSVSLSGGAAGTPAEACVRAAVMKAKVAPFNDASYSTGFTLHP
jgi:hypothetical protein